MNTRMLVWFSLLQVRKALETRQTVTPTEDYLYLCLSRHFYLFNIQARHYYKSGFKEADNLLKQYRKKHHHQQQKMFSDVGYYLVQTDADWT